MGRKGRKPESPAARRVRLASEAPSEPLDGPEMPDHMSDAAEAEWARLVAELRIAKRLSRADRGALEFAARVYALWQEAEARIESEGAAVKTPLGGVKVSPWINAAKEARRDYIRALAELGLTPRARGSKPSDGGGETPKDRLAVFLAEQA